MHPAHRRHVHGVSGLLVPSDHQRAAARIPSGRGDSVRDALDLRHVQEEIRPQEVERIKAAGRQKEPAVEPPGNSGRLILSRRPCLRGGHERPIARPQVEALQIHGVLQVFSNACTSGGSKKGRPRNHPPYLASGRGKEVRGSAEARSGSALFQRGARGLRSGTTWRVHCLAAPRRSIGASCTFSCVC